MMNAMRGSICLAWDSMGSSYLVWKQYLYKMDVGGRSFEKVSFKTATPYDYDCDDNNDGDDDA